MKGRLCVLSCAAAFAWAASCAQDTLTPEPDAGAGMDAAVDAGAPAPDSGAARDAGPADAGVTPPDAGEPGDAGPQADAGADAGVSDAGPADAGLPWGTAITAPPDTWTWVPFDDAVCNDGSPLGIGINPSPTSSNLLIYLNGGGACWDAFTCLVAKSATLGPYSQTQFNSDLGAIGNVVNRADPSNPFHDWNFVFVPYCTGDVHAGEGVVTYTSGTTSTVFHHAGHANFLAYLARLGPTFPAPAKVAVAGDSAGGAGATVNYASARAYWPDAVMYLINDSLPFFTPAETPAATMSSELAHWNVQPVLEGICTGCSADFSHVYAGLRQRFPSDRLAYMGYEQDNTMSAYYETLPAFFQLYLDGLDTQAFTPSEWKRFFVNGTNHTVLWSWATTTTDAGVNLEAWVGQMIDDDPAWSSAGP